MELLGIDKEAAGVVAAAVAALLAFVYKFFRIIKNDKNLDSIDSDEQALRMSLREEVKLMRETTILLQKEKLELLERAVKAESRVLYLEEKCSECVHKMND